MYRMVLQVSWHEVPTVSSFAIVPDIVVGISPGHSVSLASPSIAQEIDLNTSNREGSLLIVARLLLGHRNRRQDKSTNQDGELHFECYLDR